jgi:hypothetical protein
MLPQNLGTLHSEDKHAHPLSEYSLCNKNSQSLTLSLLWILSLLVTRTWKNWVETRYVVYFYENLPALHRWQQRYSLPQLPGLLAAEGSWLSLYWVYVEKWAVYSLYTSSLEAACIHDWFKCPLCLSLGHFKNVINVSWMIQAKASIATTL